MHCMSVTTNQAAVNNAINPYKICSMYTRGPNKNPAYTCKLLYVYASS